MPKYAMSKELIFYGLSVLTVCVFAFIRSHGYPFVAVYCTLYALYIVATIVAEKMDAKNEDEPLSKKENDLEGELGQ